MSTSPETLDGEGPLMILIREAKPTDFDASWPIFSEIVSAGETYAYHGISCGKKLNGCGCVFLWFPKGLDDALPLICDADQPIVP